MCASSTGKMCKTANIISRKHRDLAEAFSTEQEKWDVKLCGLEQVTVSEKEKESSFEMSVN